VRHVAHRNSYAGMVDSSFFTRAPYAPRPVSHASGDERRDGRNLEGLFLHVHDARDGPPHLTRPPARSRAPRPGDALPGLPRDPGLARLRMGGRGDPPPRGKRRIAEGLSRSVRRGHLGPAKQSADEVNSRLEGEPFGVDHEIVQRRVTPVHVEEVPHSARLLAVRPPHELITASSCSTMSNTADWSTVM